MVRRLEELRVRAAIESLLNDIEAMEEGGAWFGPFSKCECECEDQMSYSEASVEWPNLAISVERVRKALEGK